MSASAPTHFLSRIDKLFLVAVLLFVNLYSVSTLTTKPAYWYDEGLNVELARNFSDFGRLDIIVAPHVFSGSGALIGSTGYPITVPLAGFFKVFGFGLTQARVYMLLWMSALVVSFFLIARRLWGPLTAYSGTLFITTFASFYGNGRSVMGEIPGFLFFLLSFYFFKQRKCWQSGVLLGLAVISKPSVFIFLIPAYTLAVLCAEDVWKERVMNLLKLGASSIFTLLPWLFIYAEEISRGGLVGNIIAHFKNPYSEAGASALQNIAHNLPTLVTSTTLLYMWFMLAAVIAAFFLERALYREQRSLLILAGVYFPLVLLQYLKSFGYLRYLIAAQLLVFIMFLIALPAFTRFVGLKYPTLFSHQSFVLNATICCLLLMQTVHLFWFSDIFSSEKTQKTLDYISREYPRDIVGVYNVPQVGSLLPADEKYQYLSTYGLFNFGVNPLSLPPEKMPNVLIADGDKASFYRFYDRDAAFSEVFLVYRKK